MSTQDQLTFAQDLAALLRSGATQEKALSLIASHHPSEGFKNILESALEQVREGSQLSEALAMSNSSDGDQTFSTLFISMLHAGEVSGKLAEALEQLARQLERDSLLKQKIISALIYAAILSIGMLISFLVLFAIVIPQFSSLLQSQNQELTGVAATLFLFGDFVQRHGVWIGAGISALAVITFLGIRRNGVTASTLGLLRKVPKIRQLHEQVGLARFFYTAAGLLDSGLSQTQPLQVASEALSSDTAKSTTKAILEQLHSGSTLGHQIAQLPSLPALFAHSIANAEKAGELPLALRSIADRMETDFNQQTMRLTQLLEPTLILILGCFIGFIVLKERRLKWELY